MDVIATLTKACPVDEECKPLNQHEIMSQMALDMRESNDVCKCTCKKDTNQSRTKTVIEVVIENRVDELEALWTRGPS